MLVIVTHELFSESPLTWHFRRIAGRVIAKNRMVSVAPCLDASRTETSPSERRGFSRTNGSLSIAIASRVRSSTGPGRWQNRVMRSEEHTSELQSPCNLVCRLLLEKKKKR